jgi:ATP-binding cassette, subfamily B, bacterial
MRGPRWKDIVSPRQDLVSKAWRYLASERRALFGLVLLAVVAAQAESVALVFIALIADAVARGSASVQIDVGPISAEMAVLATGLGALATVGVAAVLVYTYGRLAARAWARLERGDRDRIVLSYAKSDWEYQSTQKSSRLQGRLRLMNARANTFSGLVGWSRAVATILVFVTVAAVMSPVAAAVIVGCGVVLSLAVLPIRLRTIRIARRTADVEVTLTDDFGDAVDQGPDVHVFGAWPAFIDRFMARSSLLEQLRDRAGAVKALLPVVYQYGALLIIVAIMIVASLGETSGELGRFAASALLLLRSVQYGQMLQVSLQQIASSVPAVELLQRETDAPPPRVMPGDRTLDSLERVELRGLGYQYPGSDQPALSDVSLVFRPGVIVGLAGPSGSGKSTLAQVLLRLRWPTSGEYLVNGRDAKEFSADSWSRLASHLPQEPHLLHGSLTENVTFFDPSISVDDVVRSLETVGLKPLIETLPSGMDTPLGPTGRSLSGGQVQRLAIARAFVRSPRLVVLDEPTSALDVNAERMVGEALGALRARPDVLVVVIAHRPSTLALCDEIVVLHGGRVAAAGRSEDLAEQNEFLAATWAAGGAAMELNSGASDSEPSEADAPVRVPYEAGPGGS